MRIRSVVSGFPFFAEFMMAGHTLAGAEAPVAVRASVLSHGDHSHRQGARP